MTQLPGDTVAFPLSQVRAEIRESSDLTLQRAREHCTKNTAQSVGPFQELVHRLDRQLNGVYGDDHSLGLVRKFDALTGKMSMVEIAQARNDERMNSKLDDFLDELRERTMPGTNERRSRPDSEPPSKKTPFIDKDLFKLILLVAATMAGTGGGTAAYQALAAPEEKAVQVQSEAVAEKQSDLERRERELARKEAWVERKRAQQGSAGHPATE